VQVDPMKPKLKSFGSKRSKLRCDILLLTSAFGNNLRRYIEACRAAGHGGAGAVMVRGEAVTIDYARWGGAG